MGLTIGNMTFKNQSLAKEHVRGILKKYSPGDTIKNKEDLDFLLSLLSRHPNSAERLDGFKHLMTNVNFAGYRDLWIIKHTEEIVDVSWVTCISRRASTKKQDLKKAFRTAISKQIRKWRARNYTQESLCSNCDTPLLDKKNMHVDRYAPKFSELVKLFLDNAKDKNITIPTEFDSKKASNLTCFKKENRDFELLWRSFHKNNMSLRLLCKPCNLKIG